MSDDLLFGEAHYLAAFLGVSTRTVKRWQAQPDTLPPMAKRLLQLRLGDLSAFGADWSGFSFGQDGKLYAPYHKRGFTAAQIQGMFFELQELAWLRRELKTAQNALGAAKTELAIQRYRADEFKGLLETYRSREAVRGWVEFNYRPNPPASDHAHA